MARFSIEDTLFELRAFKTLEKRLGEFHALGLWVACGRMAQFYWKQNKLIPTEDVEQLDGHTHLIELKFLTLKDNGYYFRGSEDNFLWLTERIEAASQGGRKSAQRPRDEKGRLLPKEPTDEEFETAEEWVQKQILSTQTANTSKQTPSKHQANTKCGPSESSALTLTPSLTLNLSKKDKNLATLGETSVEVSPKETKVRNSVGYFIGAYRKAFHEKYGTDPDVRGKVQGQIKSLLKDYPVDKAITLMQAYLQMEGKNGFFKTRGHDIGTFILNLNPINIALAQGQESGNINWKQFWDEMGENDAAV